jgi:hypothetical protein
MTMLLYRHDAASLPTWHCFFTNMTLLLYRHDTASLPTWHCFFTDMTLLLYRHWHKYVRNYYVMLWKFLMKLATIFQLYRFINWVNRKKAQITRRKPSNWNCRKPLADCSHIKMYRGHITTTWTRTSNFNDDRHWLHRYV